MIYHRDYSCNPLITQEIYTIMERTKEHKKIGLASESVEGPAVNAKGNESFQEGSQNDYK